MTQIAARFVITGEFLTETTRSLWNDENEPERAMAILENLHGITKDQIHAVLEGKMRLTGDSNTGVGIEPDDSGYKGKTLKQVVGKIKKQRDEAEDERLDLAQMASGDTVSMGSPTGLRKVPKRKTERRGISGRRYLKKGYEFDDILRGDFGTEVDVEPGAKPLKIWQQLERSSYLSNASASKRTEVLSDEDEDDEPPPYENEIAHDTGWLSPDGKFYRCSYGGHRELSGRLGVSFEDEEKWVKLAMDNRYGGQQFWCDPKQLTAVQKKLVAEYVAKTKCKTPYWMEED